MNKFQKLYFIASACTLFSNIQMFQIFLNACYKKKNLYKLLKIEITLTLFSDDNASLKVYVSKQI
jgi:hypothetical protein